MSTNRGNISLVGDIGVSSNDALTALKSWLGYAETLEITQGKMVDWANNRMSTLDSAPVGNGGSIGQIIEREKADPNVGKLAIALGGVAALATAIALFK